MFSRVLSAFVLALAATIALVEARPHGTFMSARQIGDLQCNANRLGIVGDLSALGQNLVALGSAGGSDPAVSAAVSSAQAGLNNCTEGITTIAKSIFTLQDAPASARDQVANGLNTIGTALDSINSTDPSVTTPLGEAQSNLAKAVQNGNNVVADCN